MMPANTRISDVTAGSCNLGLPCCAHSRSGINATGSPDVFVNTLQDHRLTDTGPTRCPHGGTFASIVGSNDVFINTLPQTRINDATMCLLCGITGVHVTGSPDVYTNGY